MPDMLSLTDSVRGIVAIDDLIRTADNCPYSYCGLDLFAEAFYLRSIKVYLCFLLVAWYKFK